MPARMLLLLLSWWMALASATAAETSQSAVAPSPLMTRIAPPSKSVIDVFIESGMREVSTHALTESERAKVNAALAALPDLHRRVLVKRLRYLSFLDGIPGDGTGLTSKVENTDSFDMTLRASIIDEPLSHFLTTKERRLFQLDGASQSLRVEATGADALTYVLLHEATHIVDISTGVTADAGNRLVRGIWASRRDLAQPWTASLAATTKFRGGGPIRMRMADAIYAALADTPFVSLYSTAAAPEDFAELVTWHELLRRRQATLTIEIYSADGQLAKQYQPFTFPRVTERFAQLDEFLAKDAAKLVDAL